MYDMHDDVIYLQTQIYISLTMVSYTSFKNRTETCIYTSLHNKQNNSMSYYIH